jgi:hypothetical protein
MPEQEHIAGQNAALRAELRLFCQLMLGSADAADRIMQQIYRRARDNQEGAPTERIRLFRIATDICGARPEKSPQTVLGESCTSELSVPPAPSAAE